MQGHAVSALLVVWRRDPTDPGSVGKPMTDRTAVTHPAVTTHRHEPGSPSRTLSLRQMTQPGPADHPHCARACQTGRAKLFRVRAHPGAPWLAACSLCVARIAERHESISIAGTLGRRPGGRLPTGLRLACQVVAQRASA